MVAMAWTGMYSVAPLIVLSGLVSVSEAFDQIKFDRVVRQMEQDALDLAKEVERLYQGRCDQSTLNQCEGSNYDDCSSLYPNQKCLGGSDFYLPACSGENLSPDLATCSGLYDYSVSVVQIPDVHARGPNRNPTDPKVTESICFTSGLDEWFQSRFPNGLDTSGNSDEEVTPSSLYFGSHTGSMRMWPARHYEECGTYDPRLRPWYVAAASGPKNILIVMDVSGSMGNQQKLEYAKTAAIRIVQTLTVSDRIAIIPFSDSAQNILADNGQFFKATATNKEFLINRINQLTAGGQTNFDAAFETAFQVFEDSVNQEVHINCNSAIVFLTDGVSQCSPCRSDEAVIDFVSEEVANISERLSKPILLFAYSVSKDAEVEAFPAKLSCSVENGIFQSITKEEDIPDALSGYYKIFAQGLSSNTDFAAWVEPYTYFGSGLLGTTVSVPVYDRSQNPPIFLGVVGVDFTLNTIDYELDGDNEADIRDASIASIVRESERSCPPELVLSECELQAWSDYLEEGSFCNTTTPCVGEDIVQVDEQACNGVTYPVNIFANSDVEDLSYEERVCCKVGTTEPSNECPVGHTGAGGSDDDGLHGAVIVVLSLVGVCLLCGLYVCVGDWCAMKHAMKRTKSPRQVPTNPLINIPPPFNPAAVASAPQAPPEIATAH